MPGRYSAEPKPNAVAPAFQKPAIMPGAMPPTGIMIVSLENTARSAFTTGGRQQFRRKKFQSIGARSQCREPFCRRCDAGCADHVQPLRRTNNRAIAVWHDDELTARVVDACDIVNTQYGARAD